MNNIELRQNYKVLKLIDDLNQKDIKYIFNEMSNQNLLKVFKNFLEIGSNKCYLNKNGLENIKKIIVYFNDNELFDLYNNFMNKDNENILHDYIYIKEKRVIMNTDIDITNLKNIFNTEKKLSSFLTGHDELKEDLRNDQFLKFAVTRFMNNNYEKFNIEIIDKLIKLINNLEDIDLNIIREYISTNLVNNLYSSLNTDSLEFYYEVLFILKILKSNCKLAENNNKLIWGKKDETDENNQNTFTIYIEHSDASRLPFYINQIVNLSRYKILLTLEDIDKLFKLIEFCMEKLESSNDVVSYCNRLKDSLNSIDYDLKKQNQVTSTTEYNLIAMQNYYLFGKEIISLKRSKKIWFFNISNKAINENIEIYYKLFLYEDYVVRYLIKNKEITKNKMIKEKLYYDPYIDNAITYLLNEYSNILNYEQINLLKKLVAFRKENIKNKKLKKTQEKMLKYLNEGKKM